PKGCVVAYDSRSTPAVRPEAFDVALPPDRMGLTSVDQTRATFLGGPAVAMVDVPAKSNTYVLPAGCKQVIPGRSWGTFTIACTTPIALFVGLWMYRIRKGRIVEASVIGGAMTLGAVILGAYIPGSSLEPFFNLTRHQTVIA